MLRTAAAAAAAAAACSDATNERTADGRTEATPSRKKIDADFRGPSQIK